MSTDLRAGIEALCADPFRGYGVNVVRVSDLRALLAAHPMQDEVTFETSLLDPVWLTTSSGRCTTRPVPAPVQVTTAEVNLLNGVFGVPGVATFIPHASVLVTTEGAVTITAIPAPSQVTP